MRLPFTDSREIGSVLIVGPLGVVIGSSEPIFERYVRGAEILAGFSGICLYGTPP